MLDQFLAKVFEWTIAAGPFAALIFGLLYFREEKKNVALNTTLDRERKEYLESIKGYLEKSLTAHIEARDTMRTLADILKGGRRNV